MTRNRLWNGLSRGVFAFAGVFSFIAMTSRGANPAPVLAYDYTHSEDGIVKDAGSAGLDIHCEGLENGELPGKATVSPVDSRKTREWLAREAPNEFSAAFWIRFDRLPSVGTPFGLFSVTADRNGYLTIRLFAPPEEMLGEYVMTTTTPVEKGRWHHVEFTYSKIQWRASLYLDGRFQWENDNLNLPTLRYGETLFEPGFRGAVRDVRFYDMALPSEYLAIAADKEVKACCASLKERARKASGQSANPHLRAWIARLMEQADDFEASPGRVTVSQVKDLGRDVSNAEKLAADIQGSTLGHVSGTPATVYTVPPLSQEPYLPYSLPCNGKITGRMRIAATRGEYENGSALVVAFKPLTIRDVQVSPLQGPDGKVIPAGNVDVKIVKRWFRSGGAWLSYHSDRRQRNLTPDLLVNDDDLIRVDEWRRRNYLRLDYPEGRRYVDVSDPAKGHQYWTNDEPFRDSETLRPVRIPEAGRNQQFLFTVHVPEDARDGIYKSRISFEGTDAWIELVVRVLPFDLPKQPSTYTDIGRTYISHLNSLPRPIGPTAKARREFIKRTLDVLRAHNAFHTSGLWDSKTMIGLSLAAGFVPDKIFGAGAGYGRESGVRHDWTSFYPDTPADELTSEDKREGVRLALQTARPWRKFFKENFPADAKPFVLFFSESSTFEAISTQQAERAEIAHRLGQKVFAHGGRNNLAYAGDIQDMQSLSGIDDDHARGWHAAGGELIDYSDPFPGEENPVWFRRKIGLDMYKAGYDGQMLHGFLKFDVPWNEFAVDRGGDGNYRNFSMVYVQQDGFLCTLALEGYREAFDDLRYATRLRQLALANRESKDNDLSRESRRQLLWLENLDGKTADLDMARLGIIDRICLLQDMIKSHKGVLPPADKAADR